jgi:hypothetical protein
VPEPHQFVTEVGIFFVLFTGGSRIFKCLEREKRERRRKEERERKRQTNSNQATMTATLMPLHLSAITAPLLLM